MQIVAMLALLGASLGQPDDPPDQDMPAAEQQDTDADFQPADEQPAEQPEANTDSNPASEQQAEQQQAEADSSATGEQPGETGNDDASAGLDMATGGRGGTMNWPVWSNSLAQFYTSDFGRTYGPFTVVEVRRSQPALILYVAVQSPYSPEQWSGVEERARAWVCAAADGRTFTRGGGIFIVNLHGQEATPRTVMITQCD